MKYIELSSERLRFRAFRQEDFPVVYDWLSSPENMKYRSSEPKTETEAHAYLDWAILCAQQEECINFRYAVELKETGELIGSCELAFTNKDPAELAWELHRNYWRKGYGTEIGHTLLKLGFEVLHLRRIVADCNTLNRGSWRIMEKIGMRREAHYVKHYRGNSILNHAWCDKYFYAILADEYFTQHSLPSASSPRDYIRWLRSQVGHERVILTYVGGCVYNTQGEVLLQRRGDNGRWGLPGGAIEPGESIRAAAVREILEETGLEVAVERLIGVYTDPGMIYPNGDKAHSICIAVEFTVLGGSMACDGGESLELRYFPMDALPELFCAQHERILQDVRAKRTGVIE